MVLKGGVLKDGWMVVKGGCELEDVKGDVKGGM